MSQHVQTRIPLKSVAVTMMDPELVSDPEKVPVAREGDVDVESGVVKNTYTGSLEECEADAVMVNN